jgi:arylamine N-acetyltransferase
VGFGDSFIKPLPLDSPGPHDGGSAPHGFTFDHGLTTLLMWENDQISPQYSFESTPHQPSDFEPASTYLQTHPDLRWTKTRFATRLLDGGPDRVTLLEESIKFRRDGEWSERTINPDEFAPLLEEWFSMTP